MPRAIGANAEYAHIVFYRTSKETLPTTNSARWSRRAPTMTGPMPGISQATKLREKPQVSAASNATGTRADVCRCPRNSRGKSKRTHLSDCERWGARKTAVPWRGLPRLDKSRFLTALRFVRNDSIAWSATTGVRSRRHTQGKPRRYATRGTADPSRCGARDDTISNERTALVMTA